MNTKELLQERAKTHGDFDLNSRIFCDITAGYRYGWCQTAHPPARQQHALMMIATKLARICSHKDGAEVREHWEDIIGYCQLAMDGEPAREEPSTEELLERVVQRAEEPKWFFKDERPNGCVDYAFYKWEDAVDFFDANMKAQAPHQTNDRSWVVTVKP